MLAKFREAEDVSGRVEFPAILKGVLAISIIISDDGAISKMLIPIFPQVSSPFANTSWSSCDYFAGQLTRTQANACLEKIGKHKMLQ